MSKTSIALLIGCSWNQRGAYSRDDGGRIHLEPDRKLSPEPALRPTAKPWLERGYLIEKATASSDASRMHEHWRTGIRDATDKPDRMKRRWLCIVLEIELRTSRNG